MPSDPPVLESRQMRIPHLGTGADVGQLDERALRDSERLFRALFEGTSTAVTLRSVDDWGLLDCNLAAIRLYGCASREELLGKTPADLAAEFQPDGTPSRAAMCMHIEIALRNGVHRCEWLARRLNGETFLAEIRISVIELACGRRVMQAMIDDITERKEAERALRRQADHDALVNRIWRRFVDGTEIDTAVDAALEAIGVSLGLERVRMRRLVDGGGVFETTYEWCAAGVAPGGRSQRSVDRKAFDGLYARLRNGEAVHIRAARATAGDLVVPASPQADVLPSALATPILDGGEVTGWLTLESTDPDRTFDQAEIGLAHRLTGVIALGRARAEADRELRRAKENAIACNVAKSAFLAHMSHELRTPLNGVIGMVDLLASTPLVAEQRRFVTIARTSAGHLLSVINDILDFSKIEAGKLDLERAEFALREVIDEIAGVLAPSAESKGLELHCESESSLPLVVGDRARLRQVLVNLASNAIKFTSRGRVSIRASLEADLALDVVVRIDVCDTGIGIEPAAQEKLFRPFAQVDTSTTRGYGGSGLGLAICREIVERMGGRVGLESTPGVGSRFWLTLTLPKGNDARFEWPAGRGATRRSWIPLARATRSARVLLVEDNAINAEVAGHTLRKAGHTFDLVSDGVAAIDAAVAAPYDVILMDCHLPKMDGYEAARRIRELEAAGRVPGAAGRRLSIIALTASATTDDLERVMECGMDLHMPKPVEPARLLAAIEAALGIAPPGPERPTALGSRNADPLRQAPPASLGRALARLQSDEGLFRKIIRQFVEGAPHAETRLEAAVLARDARAVQFETHRLRGQAASFDAESLVGAIDEVAGAVTRRAWPSADAGLRLVRSELENLVARLLAHAGS